MNLTDLSEQALASLLGLPLDKAREWLKIASSVSEEPLWLQDGFVTLGDSRIPKIERSAEVSFSVP